MSRSVVSVILGQAFLIVLAGCGSAGLSPAGPKPGEVDVGYGTQDKTKVTGAVTSLSEDDVGTARPLPIEELLRGRVPGLQVLRSPGGTVTYRIRGTNSLQNDRAPLFVVDGIQIPDGALHTALAGLTPDDIRQVDVLKDVASTSIYGMRGAGGVILITTRR